MEAELDKGVLDTSFAIAMDSTQQYTIRKINTINMPYYNP